MDVGDPGELARTRTVRVRLGAGTWRLYARQLNWKRILRHRDVARAPAVFLVSADTKRIYRGRRRLVSPCTVIFTRGVPKTYNDREQRTAQDLILISGIGSISN